MISAPQQHPPYPAMKGPSRTLTDTTRQYSQAGSVSLSTVRFGASNQASDSHAKDANPLEKAQSKRRPLKERFEDWYQNHFLQWRKDTENSFNALRKSIAKAMIVVAAIFSCFPIPNFMRDIIERRYFFSPHKVSSSHFLNSKELRQKILEVGFRPEGKNTYKLDGWYIKARGDKPTVVFCHGRDCNISNLEPIIKALSDKGYGVFVYDYPGFGQSEGNPSEDALYEAGVAACKFLAAGKDDQQAGLNVPYSQQILMGHSLGGAVAVDIAKKFAEDAEKSPDERTFNSPDNEQPQALILINTFTDLKATFADRKKEFNERIQKLFQEDKIRLKFDSKQKIAKVSMPVLVLHGNQDKTIPHSFGQELEAQATRSRRHVFQTLPGAKHRLEPSSCQQITDELDHFLAGASEV